MDNTIPSGCVCDPKFQLLKNKNRAVLLPCVHLSHRSFHRGKEEPGWDDILEVWSPWTSMPGMERVTEQDAEQADQEGT